MWDSSDLDVISSAGWTVIPEIYFDLKNNVHHELWVFVYFSFYIK